MKPLLHEKNRQEKKWAKIKPVINVLSSITLASSILMPLTRPVESHAQLPIQKRVIDAGGAHSLAIGSDGNVYAWGWNYYGQLGDGTTISKTTPVKVQGLSNVVAIAGGGHHSLALTSDGSVYAWGNNGDGRLGDGTTTKRTTPVKINGFQATINPGAPSDTTPPDPPVISADKTTPTNGDVTVTISYPSDAVTKEYRINGGNWMPYTSPIIMTNNGIVEARGIDQAGNTSEIVSYSVTNIDKIPPTNSKIQIDYNTITITPGTDQGLGVDYVQYRINSGAWTTYDSPITPPDGNYTIEAKTIDKAGNESDVVTVTTTLYGEQLASAQQAVQQASMLKTQSAVDMARIEVNNLPDTAPEKADLSTQLDDVQEEVAQNLVNEALQNPTPENIENARQSVEKVADETLKSTLQSQLQNAEDQLNNGENGNNPTMSREAYLALKAIERAEKYTVSSMVKYAYQKFNEVPENDPNKEMLRNRIAQLQAKYDATLSDMKKSQALQKAMAQVKALETAYSPTLFRLAQDAVNTLPDGDDKDILQARIDNVVDSVQNSVNAKKLEEAEKAVENAEKFKTDYYVKKATELVSQLLDGQDKQSLQQRLDALKQTPSEDEVAYQKAVEVIQLAKKYKVAYYQKKATEAINLVKDESKRQELLQLLNEN